MNNIKMIAAVSQNGVIGNSDTNSLCWNYPDDMKFFRKMTAESTVIMGRKTFDSIGRTLPKRKNIVISSQPKPEKYSNLDLIYWTSAQQALEEHAGENVWIIGGSSLYQEGLQYAQEIYLTSIPEIIKGNNLVYFPYVNPDKFSLVETINIEGENKLKCFKYRRNTN
jgi:dihydrofolate reductase